MLWLSAAGALAADVVGTVTHLSGMLLAKKVDGTARILSQKSEVIVGDTLATAEDSYARVKFTEGGEVTLRPNTQFEIREYSYEADKPERDNIVLALAKGGLRAITGLITKRNQSKFQMHTIAGLIGVRGTILGALQCSDDCGNIRTAAGTVPANGLHVDVAEGAISVTNKSGTQVYAAGQFGFVRDVNATPVIVPPTTAPKPPPPPARFDTGKAGVGKSSANECAV
ncbi:MAG: FecR domain-containing protein [Sulfuricaulis sp.]|nr:FecR domain-containing protein [Sulfuricaulis sp.]